MKVCNTTIWTLVNLVIGDNYRDIELYKTLKDLKKIFGPLCELSERSPKTGKKLSRFDYAENCLKKINEDDRLEDFFCFF